MTVHTSEHITTKAKTGRNGVHVTLSSEDLEQAGIHPGEEVVVEVRRYTPQEWIAAGEGRVFPDEEFVAYLEACPPNDDKS